MRLPTTWLALAVAGATGGAQGMLPRDEAAVVAWHADISRVAVGQRVVFASTPDGLIAYDRRLQRWLAPIGVADGLPAGPVDALIADETDGAWLRVRGTWYRASLAGGVLPSPPPPMGTATGELSPAQLAQRHPRVAGLSALLLRDSTDRAWPVRVAGTAPASSTLYVGTAGGGLFEVDPLFARATPRPFGLLSRGVGALARTADGVCVGGDGRPPGRPGVACLTDDLQHWRWLGALALEPWGNAPVVRMVQADRALWLATPRGVARIPLDGTAGTRREFPAGSAWVRELERVGDTLRLLTDRDAWVIDGRDASFTLRQAPAAADAPTAALASWTWRLPGVVAVAGADSVEAVATRDRVELRHRVTGAVQHRWPDAAWSSVAPIHRIAMDGRALWVVGAGGVLALSRRDGTQRALRTGALLPGAPTDVLLTPAVAWVGTTRGLVRLRRPADGLTP